MFIVHKQNITKNIKVAPQLRKLMETVASTTVLVCTEVTKTSPAALTFGSNAFKTITPYSHYQHLLKQLQASKIHQNFND